MAKVKVARGRDVIEIDEEKIADAELRGYSPITEEHATQIGRVQDAASIGGGAVGVGEALARGATFGLSDVVETELLGVDPEDMAARREGNTAAEIVGSVAPSLLTGGAGTVGTLARLTPAGAAARLGGGIARGRGLLGAAAGAAVEGGLQGAGETITEASLGDAPLAAERLGSGFVGGMGIGAGLGVGFHIAGRGLARATMETAKLSQQAAGKIDSLGLSVPERARKLYSSLTSTDDAALKTSLDALGTKEGRSYLLKGRDALEADRMDLARANQEAVNTANSAWERLRMETGGEARAGNAERLMSGIDNATAPARARQFMDDFEGTLRRKMDEEKGFADEMRRQGFSPSATPVSQDIAKIQRALTEARERLSKQGTSGAEAFRTVDKLRQQIGKIRADRAKQYGRSADTDSLASKQFLDELYSGARAHTVDESVYGAAGKAHAEDLAAWSDAMDAEGALRKKSPQLAKVFDPSAGEADLSTLLTLARARAGSETKASLVAEVFEKRQKAIETLKKNHDLSPELKRRIDDFERAQKQMQAQLAKTQKASEVVDAIWRVRQTGESGFSPSNVGAQGAAALGGALGLGVGGLPGAVLGGVAGALTRPYTTLRWVAGIKDMVGDLKLAESGVLANIGKMIDGAKLGRPKLPKGTLRRAATATAMKATERREYRRRQILAVRDRVNMLAAKPEEVGVAMSDPELFEAAPGVARERMLTAARAVAFLQSVAPVTYKPSFTGGVELVDPVELDRYERHVEGALDPYGTMERLPQGTFTIEHATAMRVVWPHLYQRMQMGALEEIGEREAMGRPVSYRARVHLGILLQMPLDDSMRPGLQPPQGPQIAPPEERAKAPSVNAEITGPAPMMTERIEAGGERA